MFLRDSFSIAEPCPFKRPVHVEPASSGNAAKENDQTSVTLESVCVEPASSGDADKENDQTSVILESMSYFSSFVLSVHCCDKFCFDGPPHYSLFR